MSNINSSEPIITQEKTEDGWITTADHGKQGVSSAYVHIAHSTPEQLDANRRELNRVLNRFGYKLANT